MKDLNPKIEGVLSAVVPACFIIGAIVVSWTLLLRLPYVDASLALPAFLVVPFDSAHPGHALSTGRSSPASS